MAYTKPGIEISQKQTTVSPIIEAPGALGACVIGIPYKWYAPDVEFALDSEGIPYLESLSYDPASPLTVDLTQIYPAEDEIVDNSVIVDLQLTTDGSKKHLKPSEFTVNEATGQVEILAGAIPTGQTATPIVGFSTSISGMQGKYRTPSTEELKELVGETVSWNPLGFAAQLATSVSSQATSIYGIKEDTADAHLAAIEDLEIEDPYALAPLTQTEYSSYNGHVVKMSKPKNKKERIVFTSPTVDYSSGNKQTIAEAVRDVNASINEKRYFSIHPDAGYVLENRHISTLRASFIQAFFGGNFSVKPLLVNPLEIGSKKYPKDTEITDTIIDEIIDAGEHLDNLLVYAPVPGYYYSAMCAGAVAFKEPQDPLTNVGVPGVDRIYRSNKYFSEDHLNTMAEAGTYIMVQDGPGLLYSRHQMSTNNTSIAKRELSITTAVDYVAKFLRGALKGYIGRFNIDATLLSTISMVFEGLKQNLINRGIVSDITMAKLEQDAISKDTVNMDIVITVKYPANKIKITLQF